MRCSCRLDRRFRDARTAEGAFVVLAIAFAVILVPRSAQAWRADLHGERGGNGTSVALDPAGDVIAAGIMAGPPTQTEYGFTASSRFAVAKLHGSDGAVRWRREFGTTDDGNMAEAVAVSGAGDVFAAGEIGMPTNDTDFAVVGLHGSDGSDLWSVTIAGTAGHFTDTANAVAVDSAGDVIAGGFTTNSGTKEDFFVVKLSGSDGSELWRQTINGTADEDDFVAALVVDANGDVLAAGSIVNAGTGADFSVVKLRGSDGAVLWQRMIDDPGNGFDRAAAVVVDAAGDAVATGYFSTPGKSLDIAAVKLRSSDGAVLWQRAIDGGGSTMDEGLAVSLNSAGDAVVAGESVAFAAPFSLFYTDFTVIKLSGADGSEQWRQRISGCTSVVDYCNDVAYAVAVDAGGDVFAAGELQRAVTYDDFAVVKLSGATGSELWRRVIKGETKDNSYEKAVALAVDSGGHAVAVGRTTSSPDLFSDMTVLDLREEISGQTFGFRDPPGHPNGKKFVIVSKDPGILATGEIGPASLPIGGAVLQVVNPNTGEHAEIPLPASNWRALGTLPGSKAVPRGYLYRDREGPCRMVSINSDGHFKAICKGPDIQFTLDEVAQGALGVNLKAGTGAILHCMLFGGNIVKDRPGRFQAQVADAPVGCPVP